MPATTPEAIARKAKRHNERRKQREALDPDYRKARSARREAGRKGKREAKREDGE